jgi:hypothetical protein
MRQIRLIKPFIAIFSIILLIGCEPEETPPTQVGIPAVSPLSTLRPTATEIPRINPATPTPKSTSVDGPMPTLHATSTTMPSTTPTSASLEGERLFMFVSAVGFSYRSVDVLTGDYNVISSTTIGTSEAIPGTALELAFANHTNQVAVWVREWDEIGRLWLADTALEEATLIFEDTDNLFSTDNNFPPQDVSIEWFANDKYVLVTPNNQEVEPLLVNVSTLTYEYPWLWDCNTIITSSKSQELALFCTQGSQRLVVEWNGETWLAENETEYTVQWQGITTMSQWSLSGSHFAYVAEESPDTLEIISSSEESLSIELDVDRLYAETIRWTSTGQVLIRGFKEEWPYSWFLIDSNSGTITWSLATTQEFNLSVQTQNDIRLLNGEVSTSGDYLVLATNRIDIPSGNELYLINVKDNVFEGTIANTGHGLSNFAWMR